MEKELTIGVLIITAFFIFLLVKERRTTWIGFLAISWLAVMSVYTILMLEIYEQRIALAFAIFVFAVPVIGIPFYLLSFISLLITSGVRLIKREGRKLHNFLSVGLGVFLVVWLVLSPFLVREAVHPVVTIIYLIASFAIGYFFIVLISFAVASYINRIPLPWKKYDYIIVLGSGLINGHKVPPLLASRIEKGISLFWRFHSEKHPVKMIFTGGQGSDEQLAEGRAMADYALARGMAEEQIIVEDKAANTYENLLFSKQLIEKETAESYNAIVVTNNYHVFRALLWAKYVGLKCEGAGSRTKFYFWLNALIREFIAVVMLRKRFHLVILAAGSLVIIAAAALSSFTGLPKPPGA